jgi:uncharacterized protein YuzE
MTASTELEWSTTTPLWPPSATDFDPDSGARYVTLSPLPVAFTRQASEDILIDYDKHGQPVGVEILM